MAAEGALYHPAGKFPACLPAVVVDSLVDGKLQISRYRLPPLFAQLGKDLRGQPPQPLDQGQVAE